MRARLLLAGGTFALLVALIAAVLLLSGGDDEHTFTAAPAACVDAWNDEPAAVTQGQHQSAYHHYAEVQVLNLTATGAEAPVRAPGSLCAVAFAASTLDAELAAATLVKGANGWTPLSATVGSKRLATLQSEAKSDYNATLTAEGTIEPL